VSGTLSGPYSLQHPDVLGGSQERSENEYDCIPCVSSIQHIVISGHTELRQNFLIFFPLLHYAFRPQKGHHQVQNTNILIVHTVLQEVIKMYIKFI
jgi:hypothetical protein